MAQEEVPAGKSIESVIGEELRSSAHRREKVIEMLQAAGFQMYDQETGEAVGCPAEYVRDGLRFGQLSGGQKHLIYILKYFARALAFLSKGEAQVLLVCDEVLGGIDAIRQPRVLRMLKQLQEMKKISILYISTELHQIFLMSDDVAFLQEGIICELGPARAVLELPKHSATKSYVREFRSLPGGEHLGGKLAQAYAQLAALDHGWL